MEFEAKLYNPAAQPEDFLIEHFVVRTKVFERLFDEIKTGTMEHPEQHYLIQGQRGMGKTTLLLRLKYETERTEVLKDWLLPVFFNEESYDLTSLSSLWEKLLKYFDEYLPDGGNYYSATDKFIGSNDYEQKCFGLITDILHRHGKKIVILFDNFGELFLDNLNERDSHRFREILMTCADMRIVAASSVVLEGHNDYSEPFFDFFKIINLEGLSKDETVDLIKKLQEKSSQKIDIEANKAKIETLAILTGGVIRTIMMLYEILLNDNDGSTLKDLEKILDAVTPLYKHRMEDLKPQQRRIMDVIAKNWDAISTKDISKNIRDNGKPVPSKIISAQLQELEKNNLVEKRATSTKNNLYIVKERFFNIWYLMRHGDKTSQCKVKWLTRFLEMWYGEESEGMNRFITEYIEKLQRGNYISSSALTVTNALLASSQTNAVNQALLIHATENIVSEDEVGSLPKIDEKKFSEANNKLVIKDFQGGIDLLEQIVPKNMQIIKELGCAYFGVGNLNRSIYYLSKIPNIANDPFLCYTLGLAYYNSQEIDSALHYFLIASNTYEEELAFLIGMIYLAKKEYALAERYLLLSNENHKIESLFQLSIIYVEHEHNYEKAINAIMTIIDDDKNNWKAWGLLGTLYVLAKRSYSEVTFAINQSIEINPNIINLANSARILFIIYIFEKKKKKAADLLKKVMDAGYKIDINIIFVYIWNDEFSAGIKELFEYFDSMNEDKIDDINNLLLLLISKKQYNSALKFFNENNINLKEKLKPTYYALMNLLKDEYPDEYIKMGKELEEPVKDILKKVEQYAIDYA